MKKFFPIHNHTNVYILIHPSRTGIPALRASGSGKRLKVETLFRCLTGKKAYGIHREMR
jgi:hypothetical protein